MNAYLIDPIKQTVSAIELPGSGASYAAMRLAVLGESDGYLDVASLGAGNDIVVSDDGLIRLAEADLTDMDKLPRAWLMMNGDEPHSLFIGPALWIGHNAEGETVAPPVPLSVAVQNIRFLCPAVHEVGATIRAAREIYGSCGVVDSRAHLDAIHRRHRHALVNLLLADRMAREYPLQSRASARAAMERRAGGGS